MFSYSVDDPTCEPIAYAYYNACMAIINGSYGQPWCPSDCEDRLQDYIDFIAPNATTLTFCDCNKLS